jgi:DNA-binding winged helix-turn-helix (wHTH) protein
MRTTVRRSRTNRKSFYNLLVASGKARSLAIPDLHVGSWLVQPSRNLIRNAEIERHLEPQVMDLLVFLTGSEGRVVSKDEIIDAVWQGRFIAETTLTRSIADLRRALGDDQRDPQYIETISKRGYRLVAPVTATGTNRVVLPFTRPVAEAAPDGRDAVPAARIADRLASARRRRFVGRDAEIEVFRSALQSSEPSFVVLHLNGAGGVGKTTLLQEFARIAGESGRTVVRIDGRNIEASPLGFLVALSHALGADCCELSVALERWPAGGVLLVDTYELLAGLDDWLRDTLLPQLPAGSLAVIAGRNEAGTTWRTQVDWKALTHTRRLDNLGPDESRTYLTRCGVPTQHHDDALAFTRGHPLALSLTADVLTRGDRLASARLEAEPEIVRRLIERFVQDVPSREHRLALHACVTVRALTEPLLAAALDRHDVRDLFEWLGHLSFIESGPYGLFPHDLARDVVYMDFRWRDPDAAYRVVERLIGYYYERLERSPGPEGLRTWFDLIYMQRYNPHLRPFLQWAGFGTTFAETAGPVDHDTILEMIERHEGEVSASIAHYWLRRQPEAFLMVRSMAGALIGLVCHLRLEEVTPEDLAADPAVARARAHADRHGAPAAGEHTTYCRFLMDRECYQAHVLAPIAASCSQNWTAPRLAWCFIAVADPDMLEPMFTELHIWRVRDADFEVDGRRYGVFAHDWRVENAEQWLRLKADRAWRIEDALPPVVT